jgi:dolichyl-diphosphooligosaccharide--protein glycosyltransferase
MFAATMGQIRFSAYLTINFAQLSGYLLIRVLDWLPGILKSSGIKSAGGDLKNLNKMSGAKGVKRRQKSKNYGFYKPVLIILSVVIVVTAGIYPNVEKTMNGAKLESGVSKAWYDAYIWMKTNTPDPFQDADFFNAVYAEAPEGQKYHYPESAYGVMNWWSYGHWITGIAHRIPVSNPHQAGAVSAAKYFTEQDETKANQMMDDLGTRYVTIDLDMATPFYDNYMTRKFAVIPIWADKPLGEFCEIYFQKIDGVLRPVTLYYPEYYNCMSTRLYNFSGERVNPVNSTTVVSYSINAGKKMIQSMQTFRTYEEGKAFLDKQSSPNYRLAGISPFSSPVPLERLKHYKEVYRSDSNPVKSGEKIMPFLRIFEYIP